MNSQDNVNKFFKLIAFVVIVNILALFVQCAGSCDNDTKYDSTEYRCRYVGCDNPPVNTDYKVRFCSIHIRDYHHCHYPGCHNEIPNSDPHKNCALHR